MSKQPLIYSFVAKGTVVLAEHTSFSGNFSTIAIQCLQKLPPNNNKFTYSCDGHTFNFLVDKGFVFLVVADEAVGRSMPFVFLERIRDDFMRRYESSINAEGSSHPLIDDEDDDLFEDRFSIAYNLDREFGPKLKEHMQYCISNPEEMSRLSKLKAQITEVKGIMMDNIEKKDPSPIEKRKRSEEVMVISDTRKESGPSSSRPPRIFIPEDVLNHSCIGRQHAEELILKKQELDFKMNIVLNDWNSEFVKVKFLHGEYKKRYVEKVKEMSVLENQLDECRTELATQATSLSFQRQEVERTRDELVEARTEVGCAAKDLKIFSEKVSGLEAKNRELRARLSEKEAALSRVEAGAGSQAVEDFKNSTAFKSIIQDHVQEARDHVYDVEVKALERQCVDEGFIRGFLKGTRLAYRKLGAGVEVLSPSLASPDPSSDDEDDSDSSSSSTDETIKTV